MPQPGGDWLWMAGWPHYRRCSEGRPSKFLGSQRALCRIHSPFLRGHHPSPVHQPLSWLLSNCRRSPSHIVQYEAPGGTQRMLLPEARLATTSLIGLAPLQPSVSRSSLASIRLRPTGARSPIWSLHPRCGPVVGERLPDLVFAWGHTA
ncbi:hypothetical protein NDU88_002415 [Pleurodeles waltl]|uniref:Uncharacterized protein n=1 Tax=Pleurodeles waltl TaxID=8319 RepID=A0AAV7KVL9_PLEWA|nr:hypothetical protein NDU88_002415 [Pleurodeles waltl]